MNWKKVTESKDLIIFEKDVSDCKFRIEARKTDASMWEVFKTKVKGESSSLISEYTLNSKNQVKELIKKLQEEKNLTEIELQELISLKSVNVSLKRAYKEEFIEKWFFTVNGEKNQNFLVAKYDDNITMDIIMHDKYKFNEKEITAQLEEKLGLSDFGVSVDYTIYYFRSSTSRRQNVGNEYNFNFIDIEFDFDNEENQ
jgi:hypothetical protein